MSAHAQAFSPVDLSEIDGDFRFCKERQRDPFLGKSVRLRGARGCSWHMNDLPSLNPMLQATNRCVKAIHSATSSATYTPVTAVDMCSNNVDLLSSNACVGGIMSYGREQGQVLGKRYAWDDVAEALKENAVRSRSDDFNKYRLTKDLLFDVPIIGHVISTDDHELQQSMHWPILNGKACAPAALHAIDCFSVTFCANADTIQHACMCHTRLLSCPLAAANATPCPLPQRHAPQAVAATCAMI